MKHSSLTGVSLLSSLSGNRKVDLTSPMKSRHSHIIPRRARGLARAHTESCLASPSQGLVFCAPAEWEPRICTQSMGHCRRLASINSTWRSEHAPCKAATAFRYHHHHYGLNLMPTRADSSGTTTPTYPWYRLGSLRPASSIRLCGKDMNLTSTHPTAPADYPVLGSEVCRIVSGLIESFGAHPCHQKPPRPWDPRAPLPQNIDGGWSAQKMTILRAVLAVHKPKCRGRSRGNMTRSQGLDLARSQQLQPQTR